MRRKHCASISRPLECGPAAPYIIAMTTTPTLTDAAATRVAAIAAKQAKPAILRLSVEGGGCSGFQYRFGLADTVEDDDSVSEHDALFLSQVLHNLNVLEGTFI